MTDDGIQEYHAAGVPAWGWCFIATFIVFLIQLFPLTGIFVMFLLAMFWSVILVNLGFALMLTDVLIGRAPRYLVVLPVLWFGGYAVATVVSHHQAAEFIRGIDLRNQAARAAWNPAQQDLLLASNGRSEGPDVSWSASTLVERYGLKQVFTHQALFRDGAEDDKVVIVASACPALGLVHDAQGHSYVNSRVTDMQPSGPYGLMRYHAADQLCETKGPGRPGEQPVVISVGPVVRRKGALLDTQIQPIAVRTAREISVALAGQVQPISWLPTPIIGCGLANSRSGWKCVAGFWHEEPSGTERRREPLAVVAAVLGLTESTPMRRFPDAGWR